METTATKKRRNVISAEVRVKPGITNGTRIRVEVDEIARRIIPKSITPQLIAPLRGKYRDKGLLKSLIADRMKERAR